MDGWYTGGTPPSEDRLRAEIEYYERKSVELARRKKNDHDLGALSLCRAHALHRKKLLAALRDGRPEAWQEYQPAR